MTENITTELVQLAAGDEIIIDGALWTPEAGGSDTAKALFPGTGAEFYNSLFSYIVPGLAAAGSKITKKPLKDITFPKNARIGAGTHGQEFIIPTGATHLEPGDRAVVFVMHHALNDVEKLFG